MKKFSKGHVIQGAYFKRKRKFTRTNFFYLIFVCRNNLTLTCLGSSPLIVINLSKYSYDSVLFNILMFLFWTPIFGFLSFLPVHQMFPDLLPYQIADFDAFTCKIALCMIVSETLIISCNDLSSSVTIAISSAKP